MQGSGQLAHPRRLAHVLTMLRFTLRMVSMSKCPICFMLVSYLNYSIKIRKYVPRALPSILSTKHRRSGLQDACYMTVTPGMTAGSSVQQRHMVTVELERLLPGCQPPPDINADFTSLERIQLYGRVKSMFITTRIFVVDLLTERVAPKHIAGTVHPWRIMPVRILHPFRQNIVYTCSVFF